MFFGAKDARRDRLGIEDTKARKGVRKIQSSSRTVPLKSKPRLNGPPVGLDEAGNQWEEELGSTVV